MKFLKLMLVVFVIGFSASSNAVIIAGTPSCGVWVEDRANENKKSIESISVIQDYGWLDGYLSGLAVARNKDILKDINNKSINLWMDNYCKSNPLSNLDSGANDLYKELLKRMH